MLNALQFEKNQEAKFGCKLVNNRCVQLEKQQEIDKNYWNELFGP